MESITLLPLFTASHLAYSEISYPIPSIPNFLNPSNKNPNAHP
jgi:hypothetical protein